MKAIGNLNPNSTEWDEFKAGVDENLAELKESFSTWKTGIINQYLLNEDVYIFDFANDGEGYACDSTQNRPCCLSLKQLRLEDKATLDQFNEMLSAYQKREYLTIECRRPYGMVHDGTDACWHRDLNTVTCDGMYCN